VPAPAGDDRFDVVVRLRVLCAQHSTRLALEAGAARRTGPGHHEGVLLWILRGYQYALRPAGGELPFYPRSDYAPRRSNDMGDKGAVAGCASRDAVRITPVVSTPYPDQLQSSRPKRSWTPNV
jgi:hypothetical protein